MKVIIILVVAFSLTFLWNRILWNRLRKKIRREVDTACIVLNSAAKNAISFNDDQICIVYENGARHSIRWDELMRVRIRTTNEGPFFTDICWQLYGANKKPYIVYPQGATGESELLQEMQKRLLAFDNAKLIEAMGCTNNAFFLVWEKNS